MPKANIKTRAKAGKTDNAVNTEQTLPILQKKIQAPALPEIYVPRHHLNNPLGNAAAQLVIVEAAAGYGKSVTVRQWLEEYSASGGTHSWLNVSAEDDDFFVFWSYVIAACQRSLENFDATLAITDQTRTKSNMLIADLINNLALYLDTHQRQHTLVIDNVHHLRDKELLSSIDFLANNLPPLLNLVLTSRAALTISHRAKKIASGELVTISTDELGFSKDESAEFLARHSANTDEQHTVKLLEQLTGWPMGLKFSLLTKDPRELDLAKPNKSLIYDYLIEEAFAKLPEPMLSIVSKTICLERITAKIIDPLVEGFSGKDCINLLKVNSLFLLSLERNGHYAYHPLFKEVVRQHLAQEDMKAYRESCIKAATVLHEQGHISAAIDLYFSVEEWHKATTIIVDASTNRVRSGDYQSLYTWLSGMPDQWTQRCPRVLYLTVLTSTKTKHIDLKEQYTRLDKAETLLNHALALDGQASVQKLTDLAFESRDEALNLLQEVHNLRAELARTHGKSEQFETISWDAVKRASESKLVLGSATDLGRGMEFFLRGKTRAAESAFEDAIRHGQQENYQLVVLIAANFLAPSLMHMGRTMDAIRRFENAINWVRSREIQLFPEAYLQPGALFMPYLEFDRLDDAAEVLKPYLEFASSDYSDPTQQYTIHLFHHHLMAARGDFQGAGMALSDAASIVIKELDNWNWCVTPIEAYRAKLALMEGDIVSASQWAEKRVSIIADSQAFRTEEERLILARVWLAQGLYAEAIKLLSSVRRSAQPDNRLYHVVQTHILESLCNDAAGNSQQAQSALNTALTLAEPCGFRRVFIREGNALAGLLQQAFNDHVTPNYTKSLLKALAKDQASFKGEGVLIEPLSAREVEILQLVDEGLRNKEIAERLSISLSTVKAHIYNVFSKLQSSSRTEAVSLARNLGIL